MKPTLERPEQPERRSPSLKKKTLCEAPAEEKHSRSPHSSGRHRASPPPEDAPVTTTSKKKHKKKHRHLEQLSNVSTITHSKRKHHDKHSSSSSKKKSLSQASSKKHRRSPPLSSPGRDPSTPPTEVPACLKTEAEDAAPPDFPTLSDDQQEEKTGIPKLFERVWKVEDEITLLSSMLQFKTRSGKEPTSSKEFDDLYDFVHKSLESQISRNQMMTKRIRMKHKYERKLMKLQMGMKPSSWDDHEHRCFELAMALWGEEFQKDYDDKRRKILSGGKQKQVLQGGDVDDTDDVDDHLVNLKSKKLTAVKEGYIRELQMVKELMGQLTKLEAEISRGLKAIQESGDDDFDS